MSSIYYRPEIDGLRAIAVIAVVLFHAHLGFPGGFIGVDVFFVISGFLITSIIKKEFENGAFLFSNFFARRIKRILPAACFMILCTLFTSYHILETTAFMDVAKSSIAQSTMLANIYFWKFSGGYFAASTELQPLLHMWSLSIEEQFYIFFPLVIILILKYKPKWLNKTLFILIFSSFILCYYATNNHPSASFYLLPTRAWELMCGALLALNPSIHLKSKIQAEITSFVGLVIIITAMFVLNNESTFPGVNALAPVLGSLMFILGSNKQLTIASKLLSNKFLVFVGLISYSLYLWHWPILAFSKQILITPNSLFTRIICVVISIPIAILSWKYIETPFRNSKTLKLNSNATKIGLTSTSIIIIVSCFILKLKPSPEWSKQYQVFSQDINYTGEEYSDINLSGKTSIGNCDKKQIDFAIWGDSHGLAIASQAEDLANILNLKGALYLRNANIPVINLKHQMAQFDMINYNQKVVKEILEKKIKHVIFISRWTWYVNENSLENAPTLVTDKLSEHKELNSANSIKAVSFHLNTMGKLLKENGVKAYIIKQVPEATSLKVAHDFYLFKKFPNLNNNFPQFTTKYDQFLIQQQNFNRVLNNLDLSSYIVIDPSVQFFQNPEKSLEIYSNRSHYRDNDHLTKFGAEKFMRPHLKNILLQLPLE
ncbi:acyltransferase family protein [Lentisphaera marina]|uniref:acyltransferase family protein n=1 Tax=Lentisphaera marina TaxID=1111041 RepID=UPI00236677FD|nr:acyltransferase family protein [Lentisphaera marina]MDD7986908.1 acyltransferase family protein [Lentisphaera marina]